MSTACRPKPNIPTGHLDYMKRNIYKAMHQIQDVSCIRFVTRTNQEDYIEIKAEQGCASEVGRQRGRQVVSLDGPFCMGNGVIVHELNHAIGFWHEQNRPDRDNYVIVIFENIKPGTSLIY
uniref:Metalloendopeptidase n=1 Tax=Strigamia maritima TaxID=126957 RepID=T1IJI0_STRMM